jgi:hypothetical protein
MVFPQLPGFQTDDFTLSAGVVDSLPIAYSTALTDLRLMVLFLQI